MLYSLFFSFSPPSPFRVEISVTAGMARRSSSNWMSRLMWKFFFSLSSRSSTPAPSVGITR